MVTASARREWVRWMVERGLSERKALSCARMSASSLRYEPRDQGNSWLIELIGELAAKYRRYGAPMIYLKIRQAGHAVNHKRVQRLYSQLGLQVRKRRRKKVPLCERQPLTLPATPNDVWSWDFVFDRTADGRVIKCLTLVDDATKEALAIEVERSISGQQLTRILDRIAISRPLPRVIRSDNGKEFCSRAMQMWAHEHRVELRTIQPGKPTQNAYIESFNGRFRDECLNDHWFVSLHHARATIRQWQNEYNTERPKKSLNRMTPNQYAAHLAQKHDTFSVGL